ncbi:MAG: hypothetical protein HY934_10625 [Candidatus Firestonebacteria bacterium]|nr:hypothetical protein [Candidatus Firestonebacteria bacterium]
MIENNYENIDSSSYKTPYESKEYNRVKVGSATNIDLKDFFIPIDRSNKITPIWTIKQKAKTFYVRKPITIKTFREDNLFFVENDNLGIYGFGESPQEALEDFKSHIIYFYNYYKNLTMDQITGDAIRLKKLYKNLLVEDKE